MGAVITAFPSENLVFGTYKNVNKPNSLYGNTAEWNITKDFCLYLIKNGPIRNHSTLKSFTPVVRVCVYACTRGYSKIPFEIFVSIYI